MTRAQILKALKLASAEDLARELSARRGTFGGPAITCGHDPPEPNTCGLCHQRVYRRERRAKGLDR